MPTPRELEELAETLDWSALSDEALATCLAVVPRLAEGFPKREVADQLGLPYSSVQMRIRQLRAEAEAQQPD